jgi:hypothetical protein
MGRKSLSNRNLRDTKESGLHFPPSVNGKSDVIIFFVKVVIPFFDGIPLFNIRLIFNDL